MRRGPLSGGDIPRVAKPNVGGYAMTNNIASFAAPSYMYNNAMNPNGPRVVSMESEDNRIGPIVSETRIAALTDDSQLTLCTGDYLFAFNPDAEVKEDVIVMNLATLNYYLERTYRDRVFEKPQERTRKRQLGIDTFSFPLTIQEFTNQIVFLGIMIASDSHKQIRSPTISYAIKGYVKDLANIFGPVNYGDSLELRVRSYKNTYNQFIDFNGNAVAHPTVGTFLQVRPFINRETRHPIVHQTHSIYEETDLDFFEPTVMRQKVLKDPPMTGIYFNKLHDSDDGDTGRKFTVDTSLPTEGLSLMLGIVTKCKKQPHTQTCLTALRSPTITADLIKNFMTIEIALDLNRRQMTLGSMQPLAN